MPPAELRGGALRDRLTRLSVPDPTPVLFLIAAASALLYSMESMRWAALLLPGIILLPAIIYFFSSNLSLTLGALMAAAVMSRLFVEIGSLKARPEHIIIGLLSVVAVVYWRRKTEPLCLIPADYLLLAYVGMNFFSSLTVSIDPSQTLKWAIQQTVAILAYFLLRIFVGEPKTLRRAVGVLVAVGAAEGAYALVSFYSNMLFHTAFGVEIDQYVNFPGTYGTMYEANILGAFSAASLVIALVMYFSERRRIFLVAASLTYASLIIALSRAAIIAAGVAVALLILSKLRTKMFERKAVKTVGGTLLAVSLVLAPAIIPLYEERFSTVETTDIAADPNTAFRLVSIALAIDDILQRPVLGNGTSSFQLMVRNSEVGISDTEEGGAWIGNLEVRLLHDTGIVGFIIFVSFLVCLAAPARKLLRRGNHPELLALALSGLVYAMTFQATEGTLLAFSWVHLGLIGCAIAIYSRGGEDAMGPMNRKRSPGEAAKKVRGYN